MTPPVTIEEAAKDLNVSKRSVERGIVVLDHGTPELIALVEAGKAAVSVAAEIAVLPAETQRAIVANPGFRRPDGRLNGGLVRRSIAMAARGECPPIGGPIPDGAPDWKAIRLVLRTLAREVATGEPRIASEIAAHLRAALDPALVAELEAEAAVEFPADRDLARACHVGLREAEPKRGGLGDLGKLVFSTLPPAVARRVRERP